MPKANFKRLLLILLPLTAVGIIGCSNADDKKDTSLKEAESLRASGDSTAALTILEKLGETYPDDPEILKKIGEIFKEEGDVTMAAFFLERAQQLAPDDVELLYQTFKALKAADQPAGPLLEKLVKQAPESMNSELWLSLGEHYMAANKSQSALDAYLKGVNPEVSDPPASTATAIGQLFVQLENDAQAERWLSMASESESPDALPALFSLLELKLSQTDWEAAEAIIVRLDEQFPGALDASEWESARSELESWRTAQNEMEAELAKTETAQEATNSVVEVETVTTVTAEITENKEQIIADMEAAESLANTPATEVMDQTSNTVMPAIIFNPAVAIEPAEPDLTVGVTFDQATSSDPIDYSVENTLADIEASNTPITGSIEADPVVSLRPTIEPRSVDELFDEANSATLDKNYRLAITNYWQILGIATDRDDVWNLLSRAYLVDGQLKNAETTALEAIRLSPRDINYTLDYLRVAQRSKQPAEFFAELETAYDRFPQSPEVTLSLARGYERIVKNSTAAGTLYQRFLDIAPSHPLRPEAEAAIQRLP
ncbi:MAG: tetratricopeptide repeat protein [Opitutaceae bacterium]